MIRQGKDRRGKKQNHMDLGEQYGYFHFKKFWGSTVPNITKLQVTPCNTPSSIANCLVWFGNE